MQIVLPGSPASSESARQGPGACRASARPPCCAPGRRRGGRLGAALLLLATCCAVPAIGQEGSAESEGHGTENPAEQSPGEELLFGRAALTAIDHYMVGLKAVHRWREAVAPVETRRRSRLRRRELGGSEAPDLVLAQRRWREAQVVLEGAPAATGAIGDLRAALSQAIRGALEGVGEFRLVGAELDPTLFDSGSIKLCLADETILQVVQGLHQFLEDRAEEAGAAELLALHGTDLRLHAHYLRTRGCR